MAYAFDNDPLGAVLEFGVLFGTRDVAARAAWGAANIKQTREAFSIGPQLWLGPAMNKSLLEDALAEGRNREHVRRVLERAFRTLENHHLVDVYPRDDNPSTRYRVVNALGEELVGADAHREYVHGLQYVVQRWSKSVVCLIGNKGHVGTGFFVSARRIATARHVIDENGLKSICCQDGRDLPVQNVRTILPKDEDSELDVAIIEFAADVSEINPMRLAGDRSLLDEVALFGFPPLASVKSPQLHVNRGEISAEPTLDNGQQVIVVTALLRGGYSGGPALNRRGEVVGLVSKNLYKLTHGERDVNESLGAAALVPYEWISDLMKGTI